MSWGQPQSAAEKLAAFALMPAAAVYGVGSYLRRQAYDWGCLKCYRPPVRTISVGNITCGGTGKTPITIDLAQRLIKEGGKVAILSRGYRRKSSEEFVVAGDGNGYVADATECGDEPFMMASLLSEAVVLVGARRRVTAEMAVNLYGCNVLLLDDGFQHLSLQRDDNLLLLDYAEDPHADSLLPAGRLREPLAALSRATHMVVTRVADSPEPKVMERFRLLVDKYAPAAKLSGCRLVPSRLRMFNAAVADVSVDKLKGLKVVAFCGLARPEQFFATVESLGATVVARLPFADHRWYEKQDLEYIKDSIGKRQADILLTTQKDAARLAPHMLGDLPLGVLELKVQWLGEPPLAGGNMPVSEAAGCSEKI